MIVIGADPHMKTHTLVAVETVTGEQLGCETIDAARAGSERALAWANRLGAERVWAIEDCRHVSGRLEGALLAAGEHVIRVPPKLMSGARKSVRERGKSDPIDALAVARAAIREGIHTLPTARLAGPELEVRLLVDHREDLVWERSKNQQRLRWHLHAMGVELDIPNGALDRKVWLDRVARRLGRVTQDTRARIAKDLIVQIRTASKRIAEIERELGRLTKQIAPQLLEQPGVGALVAAKLIGEIAGADRFSSDAKLARAAGVAPIPATSGRTQRHRLDRGGNRQLNAALHRWAVTAGRCDPKTADYLARKQAEGKSRREALRCLKRHLARRAWQLLLTPPPITPTVPEDSLSLT